MPWHAAALAASGHQICRQKLWTIVIADAAWPDPGSDAVAVSSSQLASGVRPRELICRLRQHIVICAVAQRDGAVGIATARGQIPIRHGAVSCYGVIRVKPFLDAAFEG
jgi:hypothetical protein